MKKMDPVLALTRSIQGTIDEHAGAKAKDVLAALDVLVNRYIEDGNQDGAPLGPLSRFVLEAVRKRLLVARKEHDRLSKAFAALQPLVGAENARKQMGEISKEMQDVWEPFREFIGACPDCSVTRIAGTDRDFVGFGCPQCGKLLRLSEASGKGGGKR